MLLVDVVGWMLREEGGGGEERIQHYTACQCGEKKAWARGKDRYDLEPEDVAVTVMLRIPTLKCTTPLCENKNWAGSLKCDFLQKHILLLA